MKLVELERAKGFEPSTSTLARLRSTPELRPLIKEITFINVLIMAIKLKGFIKVNVL